MTRLLQAELRRAMSRRLVRTFALLSLVAAVAVGGIAFLQTSSGDDAAIRAEVAAAREEAQAQEQAFARCVYEESLAGARKDCVEPRRAHVDDPRLERERVNGLLKGGAAILALMGWVVGASLVGAEHQSRGITTTLTFAPSRGKVFAAKAAAAVLVASVWAAATLVLVLGALLPAAILHAGSAVGQPGNLEIAGAMGRGVALTALTATIGFALASLGRNTSAALGLGFAYIIVVENILGSSIAGWRGWLLLGNFLVFLTGSAADVDVTGRSVLGAGVFLAAVAGGLLAAGAVVFRTRDVA